MDECMQNGQVGTRRMDGQEMDGCMHAFGHDGWMGRQTDGYEVDTCKRDGSMDEGRLGNQMSR